MKSTIRGALYGALIGDALGVPYEFHNPDHLPFRSELEMIPPYGFNRAHPHTPPGTWSDDGALMLALMDSLIHNPSLDLEDYAKRMTGFMTRGRYAIDGRVFDIGMQTQAGLGKYIGGVHPSLSGGRDVYDNGNGSLMRVLPVAFLPCSTEETIRIAMQQGLPTHGHLRSQLVCALYALVASELATAGTSIKDAHFRAKFILQESPRLNKFRLEADRQFLANELDLIFDRQPGTGSGYVVDTYWSAIDCLESTTTFEECLQAAVALGNDTDTTACVAGGLAGLYYGYDAIPTRWIEALRGKEGVEELITNFTHSVIDVVAR